MANNLDVLQLRGIGVARNEAERVFFKNNMNIPERADGERRGRVSA